MKTITALVICVLTLTIQAKETRTPHVQLAILLDTSSSMSGLIDQAKTELWKVVNEFATAKQYGVRPDFKVALYEYGKSSLPRDTHWIRQISPLTDDLDKISEALFALTTNGGQEYCGQVIHQCTKELGWSADNNDLKVIFIAGNEAFTQGPMPYADACKAAISKGIVVNTIFCGGEEDGVNGKWKDGAVLTDGSYLSINHNAVAAHVAAPQDKEIARLGQELNTTYVAYGDEGSRRAELQSAQDMNATHMGAGVAVDRAVSKSSALYTNSNWDLVDATKGGKVDLEQVAEADLPEPMKKMAPEERKAYVTEQSAKRMEIQKQIGELNTLRQAFIAENAKTNASDTTLSDAMRNAVQIQGKRQNFVFGGE